MVFSAKILTLYPEMFPGPLGHSLAGKALHNNIWSLDVINIRDYAFDKHKNVDDTPYGGGAGMVMRSDVLARAIDANTNSYPLYYLSPRGRSFTQKDAYNLAFMGGVNLLCGHFEGIDERLLISRSIEEISIGDYILSGGEIASFVFLDAIIRLLPSTMGNESSAYIESFDNYLLEYPHYTRPRIFEGLEVPEVLLSGHHKNIAQWRLEQQIILTQNRRPDLYKLYTKKLHGED